MHDFGFVYKMLEVAEENKSQEAAFNWDFVPIIAEKIGQMKKKDYNICWFQLLKSEDLLLYSVSLSFEGYFPLFLIF